VGNSALSRSAALARNRACGIEGLAGESDFREAFGADGGFVARDITGESGVGAARRTRRTAVAAERYRHGQNQSKTGEIGSKAVLAASKAQRC
jgi:hypothetical protein